MDTTQSTYNWKNKTLLIAEDEDFNFMFLEEVLSITHANIIRAMNGAEALKLLKETPNIDLILMDVQMPIMNGYEATEEIRKQQNNIPIIAQTAYTFCDAVQKIEEAGCNEYITKPIDMDVLLETIQKYL